YHERNLSRTSLTLLKGTRIGFFAFAWSPDCKHLVSGSKAGELLCWDPQTGSHWAIHLWATKNGLLAYLGSQLICSLHVVGLYYKGLGNYSRQANSGVKGPWTLGKLLALSTEYVLRTGAFDHTDKQYSSPQDLKEIQQDERELPERLVSGSDDFTMFLWEPAVSKHPKTRMTGHQQLVNHVYFSPDGQWVASASFDTSVKLWNGITGKFVAAFEAMLGPSTR
ncbi:hypothetical protein Dimus_023313, partial [Dionaea muscipula]